MAIAILSVLAPLWMFAGDNESFFGFLGFIAFPPGFLLWSAGVSISLIRSE